MLWQQQCSKQALAKPEYKSNILMTKFILCTGVANQH